MEWYLEALGPSKSSPFSLESCLRGIAYQPKFVKVAYGG